MEETKQPIALTNNNTENMSRMQMLEWVNTATNGNYTKIEQLCNGVAYCQLMEQLFPSCIGLKKIKATAKLDHEQMHNLRLLQMALTRLNFDKTVPIERLLKGRFQDNLEFLQWFIKFYNSSASSEKPAKQLSVPEKKDIPKKTNKQSAAKRNEASKDSDSPNALLTKKIEEKSLLETQISLIESERNLFYKKLTCIEALVADSMESKDRNTGLDDWCQRCLNILYSEDAPSN